MLSGVRDLKSGRDIIASLAATAAGNVGRLIFPDHLIIFTLHRFGNPRSFLESCPVQELRQRLSFLRRHQIRPVGMDEVATCIRDRIPLRTITNGKCGVAFTVDDGYRDFLQAAPVFAEFEFPVTVFLTSGFVDSDLWHWWDKVEWMVRTVESCPGLPLELEMGQVHWTSHLSSQRKAYDKLCGHLKTVPSSKLQSNLNALSQFLGVSLPTRAPDPYMALEWKDARRLSNSGVAFGPHTVTHPILAQCDSSLAEFEIRHSYQRLKERLEKVLPVFAYPNGDLTSFGNRERTILRDLDIVAAVSTVQSLISDLFARDIDHFALPRLTFPAPWHSFIFDVSGLRHLRKKITTSD